jgi:molybdate transport system permease protein
LNVARTGFAALLALTLATALLFLLLPVVAIFLEVAPNRLLAQMTSDAAVDALHVTLKTNLVANAFILAIGTPAAYLLATRRFRGRALVITCVELPLVLPPAVAGIGLLAAFGSQGLLGDELNALGIEIAFTEVAVMMAVAFVASPFYLRQAIAAFEAVDRTLLDASRTLGAGPGRTFLRVALPLAGAGLGAGAALAFARGIGEFGATIMFAGSLQGVTQTLSLAVYEQFGVAFEVAIAISALLVAVSGALLLAIKVVPGWTRSTWTSPSASAPSRSS